MLFSQTQSFAAALVLMMLSRVGMAVTSVLNNSQLLHRTPGRFRGRVFATMEALRNAVMIVSMAAAGIASQYYSARTIGLIAGVFGFLTACAWAWCDFTGNLPEPVIPLLNSPPFQPICVSREKHCKPFQSREIWISLHRRRSPRTSSACKKNRSGNALAG